MISRSSLLLLLWILIGAGLRFLQLADKSPWTDEFSTLVFSLGNSFKTVPIDQVISIDQLLQPLVPAYTNVREGIHNVVNNLLSQSNHPPAYFVLAHLWMHWFPTDLIFPPAGLENYVSLWVARALPAVLGVCAIPAIFSLAKFTFSPVVAHFAAAMMAVSPYGIYLAQEARHYTLAILLAIISFTCLVKSIQCLDKGQSLPASWVCTWIITHSVGIAVHYFFSLTICSEALVLITYIWFQKRADQPIRWKPLLVVALGTLAGALAWVPVWQSANPELTDWIYNSQRTGLEWISPLFQSLAAWVTMLVLLPVESPGLTIVIIASIVMLTFLIWVAPILWKGLKIQQNNYPLFTNIFLGIIIVANLLFFIFTYFLGIDLTRGARYHFIYFPAAILILSLCIAAYWQPISESPHSKFLTPQKTVVLILTVSFLSGITVATNLGYQKYYRPDLFVPAFQQTMPVQALETSKTQLSHPPVLIATLHKTHVQTGEMMGLAWELKRRAVLPSSTNLYFLLAHQKSPNCPDNNCQAAQTLSQTLNQFPLVDLWLINFEVPMNLESQNCRRDSRTFPNVDGYDYSLYHCRSQDQPAGLS